MYAVYFPQFHRIAENDANFYEAFTDMRNLEALEGVDDKETPCKQMLGLDSLSDYDVVANDGLVQRQFDMLRDACMDGFATYLYWFSTNTVTKRRRIMHEATDRLLHDPRVERHGRKVFFVWANEDWSGNAAFGASEHQITNRYGADDADDLAADLVREFASPHYLKLADRPVLYVHHPWLMAEAQLRHHHEAIDRACKEVGFAGVEFRINSMAMACSSAPPHPPSFATYDFHPNYKRSTSKYTVQSGLTVLDYAKYIDNDLQPRSDVQTVFFDFDNRARLCRPDRHRCATVCVNSTPPQHERYLRKLKAHFETSPGRLLLVNAWNEWGERMHIEPSAQRGLAYVNLLKHYFRGGTKISVHSTLQD